METTEDLTANFDKLSTDFKVPLNPHKHSRKRAKSVQFDTPMLPKPNLSVFHSTGILRKSRESHKLTPETPIKQKRLLPSKIPISSQFGTPLGKFNLKPPIPTSLISQYPKPPFESTPSKQNRRIASPLNDTPTKGVKRPYLFQDGDTSIESFLNSSPTQNNFKPQPPLLQNNVENSPLKQLEFSISPEKGDKSMDICKDLPNTSIISNPSPVVPAKVFFSRLVKERKISPSHPIPFLSLLSPFRTAIDQDLFQALEGRQPGLERMTKIFSSRSEKSDESIQNYFETSFDIVKKLGHGAFADAYHVISLETGEQSAVKKTRHEFVGYNDAVEKLNEVKMLQKVRNTPYCVSIQDSWIQQGFIYIQTELCSGGSLDGLLFGKPLPEQKIWKMLSQILLGLTEIHSQEIVHLDIKPGNIFVTAQGNLKIGDFGLATTPPVVNSDLEGDRRYLAPEILNSSSVSYPADIYSLGLIILEIAAHVDLPQNGDLWQQLREGNIDGFDECFLNLGRTLSLQSVMKQMLKSYPPDRPSSKALLSHPHIAKIQN